MSEAPERIWLTGFVKDEYGARLGRGTISDLDHGQNPDYPEYVRADRIEKLEERLKAATDDAKEAEAYAGELEAKLGFAVDMLNKIQEHYGRSAAIARSAIYQLTGGKDE